ncbi:MAG: DUF6443 domain-containing protein [Cyclobacteriaceae bacterium]
MKKLITIVLFIQVLSVAQAQISGRSTVLSYTLSNSVEIYQVDLGRSLAKAKWTFSGGVRDQQFMPISGTYTYKIGIKWDAVSSGTVSFSYEDGLGDHTFDLNVSIYPFIPAPSSSLQSTSYNCGSTNVVRSSSPPNAIQWYWQTQSGGTRTDLGYGSSLVLNSTTNLYLRSRATLSPSPWGGELYFGNVVVYSTRPTAPTVARHGSNYPNAPIALSVDPVPSATGYKWYTQASGGTAIGGVTGTSYSVHIPSTTSYYVSSVNGPCESLSRLQVTATVLPLPTNPALFNPSCALKYDAALQNTYFYRYDMTGIPIDHSSWSVSGGQIISKGYQGNIYYALVNWTTTGSASIQFNNDFPMPSGPAPINVVVYDMDTPLSLSFNANQYNCGNTIVSSGSVPNSCEQFFWQTTSDTQTDLGSGSSVNLSSSSNVYVRRKWNIYPYPWGARQYVGNVSVYTFIPSPPTIARHGNNYPNAPIALSVDPVPSATGYKWYTQASGGTAIGGATGTSYTVHVPSTTSYFVSSINGPCESSNRLQITATVLPLPTNPALFNPSCALKYDASLQNTYFYRYDMTGIPIDHSSWSVSGGQITSKGNDGNIYYAFVNWTIPGSASIQFNNDFPLPSGPAPINVTVYDKDAPLSLSFNANEYSCGNTVVSRSSLPTFCEQFFWQTTSDTQTDLGSGSSVNLSSSSDLYVRRKWNIYPYPWGARQYLGSVAVYQAFVAQISPVPTAVIPFNGTSVQLSAIPTGSGLSYQWQKNGENIASATGSSVGAGSPGNYTVKVSSSLCNSTSAPTVVIKESDYNYIITRTLQTDKKSDGTSISEAEIPSLPVESKAEDIVYFDGIGRPMQTVGMQASSGKKDLVTPIAYDAFGREARKYLQYASSGNNGWYKPNQINLATGNPIGEFAAFYNSPPVKVIGDPRHFTETIFEPSPLNRSDKDFGYGQDWKDNNRFVAHGYLMNGFGENIIAWIIDAGGNPVRATPLTGSIETGGYYSPSQLQIKSTKDEQGNEVREYVDKEGRLVLKKVQAESNPSLNNPQHWAQTYYVYDDLGILRFVLQPELSKTVHQSNTYNPSITDLANFAFQYRYDGRKRMTHKKVPGADWVYMVYNNRDQLVMTQDGEQRKGNRWNFTKYDMLNRPIITGIYWHSLAVDQAAMCNLIDPINLYESYDFSSHDYSNRVFPINSMQVLTVQYYDSYDFLNKANWDEEGNSYAFEDINGNKTFKETRVQTVLNNNFRSELAPFSNVNNPRTYDPQEDPESGNWFYYNYGDHQSAVNCGANGDYLVAPISLPASTPSATTNFFTATIKVAFPSEARLVVYLVDGSIDSPDYYQVILSQIYDGEAIIKFNFNINNGYSFNEIAFQIIKPDDGDCYEIQSINITRDFSTPSDMVNTATLTGYPIAQDVNQNVKGYHTGSKLYSDLGKWLNQVTYYDQNYRSIQTVEENHLQGIIRSTSKLDFVGKIEKQYEYNSQLKLATEMMYNYDHAGRLLKTQHSINGASPVLLSQNEYNELGQLVDKKLHSIDGGTIFKQSVDYRYNIRGWLTKINESDIDIGLSDPTNTNEARDLFGMELGYNTNIGTGNIGLFNGNISAIKWSNNLGLGSNKQNAYNYSYDAINRLISSNFKQLSSSWGTLANNGFNETAFQYDLIGNIQSLKRNDKRSMGWMDDLGYNYAGNQLMKVNDTGDKTKGFIDGANVGNDYTYDANGNMTTDANKQIRAIYYNRLNLPGGIVKNDNSLLASYYNSVGKKLQQMLYNPSGALKKKSDYVGNYFYENDTLRFIHHNEGRIVANNVTFADGGIVTRFEYQYHLKDHLGNVRLTFTSKDDTDNSTANYEADNVATEQGKFLNRDKVRRINSVLFDRTYDGQPVQPNGTFAQRLSGRPNEKIGLARSLSVMPGDKINIEVYAKYYELAPGNDPGLASLMAAIISGVGVPAGTFVDGAGYGQTTTLPFIPGWGAKDGTGNAPMAYLNWMVFDRNYVQDLDRSGFKRITANSKETGSNVAHDRLAPDSEIVIAEAGYMYIWLSNDNPTPVEVYFDDFKVTHIKSPVIQSDDYYPFGARFNSYSRENSLFNKRLYNAGSELQTDLDLGTYMTELRMYDPWGRLGWWSVDPMVDEFYDQSPYNYSFNNPIRYNDPRGDCPTCPPAQWELDAVSDGQLGAGLVESVTDAAKGLWNLVTTDPRTTFNNVVDGIATLITDPGAVKDAVVSDFKENPTKFGGKVLGNAIMGVATGGVANELKGATGLAKVEKNLQSAANKASDVVGNGKGPVHGTKVHTEFSKINVKGTTSEVSYKNGQVVPYGTKGSVRVDKVAGDIKNPKAIYDLKTGGAKVTPADVKKYQQNVPGGPTVKEIKPN